MDSQHDRSLVPEPSPAQPPQVRVGAAALMLGVIAGFAGFSIGPMVPDAFDLPAVLHGFADAPTMSHLHGLGISVSALLLLVGYSALTGRLADAPARWWARAGLAAAAVKTSFHLMGATLGGSVLPTLAAQALDGGPDAPAAAAAAGSIYVLYEALLAPTFLTLALTTALYSAALIASTAHASVLGWAGLLPTTWSAVGGVTFILVGPLPAAELLPLFVPGFMLAMVWVFAVGVVMWRSARPGRHHSRRAHA
jgi:hypothetical protein